MGQVINAYNIFVSMPDGKSLLRKYRLRDKNNIKTDLKNTKIDFEDWIGLSQDVVQWRTLVNTVMKLRVLQKAGNF